MSSANPLGDRIRTLRKEKGLTLDQLAEQSGSSKSYIWELENKSPPRPSAEKLVKKGMADLVIYFANSQMELQKQLPKVKERLEPKGALWVAYVKGTSRLHTGLHRDTIREYGESIGLTSVAMIAIDEDWSALRLKST